MTAVNDDNYTKPKQELNPQTGLPVLDEDTKNSLSTKASVSAILFPLISTAIGYGIAYAIYAFAETEKYDERIALAKTYDMQWFLLAAVVFSLTVAWLNMYPMRFKERVMGGPGAGNLRANMFIYKLATAQADEGSAVVLHDEGDLGRYNRGNRSIYHFLENCLPLVVAMPISFFLFPLPTFVCVVIYCFGRIVYQIGYTKGGYGSHGIGFLLDKLSSQAVIGLLIVAYTKMVFAKEQIPITV